MRFHDYVQHDATSLADYIRRGRCSPTEIRAAALEAIQMLNPTINAVIETWPSAEASVMAAGDSPFFGVPFLIKDLLIQKAGELQEMGTRLAVGNRSKQNSYLMDSFERLGFVTLGRTTTPEFGFAPTTESVLSGITRNPWNLDRMAGGSSGGSAAAIASGMVPIAHANDAAGSIRNPAACCGLIGLKPSRGRVTAGPGSNESAFGMAAEFVLCRSVRDAAALLDGVGQPMAGDPFVIWQPDHRYSLQIERPHGRLRIGYTVTSWYDAPLADEIVAAVEQTAARCRALGHDVVMASPEFDYSTMRRACITLMAAGIARWAVGLSRKLNRPISEATVEAATWAMIRFGESLSASDLLAAFDQTNQVCRSVAQFFTTFDLLITATTANVALPVGTFKQNAPTYDHEEWFDRKALFPPFLAVFNVTGQPAMSLPIDVSKEGLPIGIQFVGRFGREDVLLSVARQLENESAWAQSLVRNQIRLWESVSRSRQSSVAQQN